jgi:2-oxoisovalerate dehydrogenase E1 component
MEGITIDGNNIIEVYDTVKGIRDYCIKNQRPYLIECMTFRMRGHEEASGTKYVPKELFEEWGKKDPVVNYENYLLANGILTEEMKEEVRGMTKDEIEEGLQIAFAEPPLIPETEKELRDVYAPVTKSEVGSRKSEAKREMRLVDAIAEGMKQAMEKHDNLILMGQDIAEYGGVFKVTDGLVKIFGKDRVRNTPLCESAILGAALGFQ